MRNHPAVVEVAVPRPLRQTFDYAAPTGLPAPVPGMRVRVPFGPASVVGVVTAIRQGSPFELKAVDQVLDDGPLLPADLLELAAWLASYYHHPIGDVIATLLPAKARRGAAASLADEAIWQVALDADADAALARAPVQRAAFARLCEAGSVRSGGLAALAIDRRTLAALRRKGLVVRAARRPAYVLPDAARLTPTAAQAAAVDAISKTLGGAAVHLLDGVTGSGKTEVYLRVIEDVLRAGRQALVLVPEIALTPQTTARFAERFGAAATLHSAATDTQRFDTWLKCSAGVHRVLIGTRSAVFAPFQDLGVVVVDEEHDSSFKQRDGLPYSARDVAVKRGQLLGVPVLLGSATPSLESLENVSRRRYRRHRLPQRAGGASMPACRIVDVRGERLQGGFGATVRAAMARHLDAGSQVLVLVNRRGYAPVMLCPSCAWQAHCDHCDAKLICHLAGGVRSDLRCHHCGHRRSIPAACPACGGGELVLLGVGTQRVEAALAELHPDVPRYRIDRDTARSVRRLERDLDAVRSGASSILVGTQMLAKGHHLPNVTLVAVLDADSGFLASDFRAPERTAQLIVQVAGRAGRAARPGEVLIQTLQPDNPNLLALIDSGYHGFAAAELRVRAAAGMPPFAALAMVRAESRDERAAIRLLETAAAALAGERIEVLGPAPAPLGRRADRYRSQLLLLSSRRRILQRALARLARQELKAPGVRWSIDVDPADTF